MSNSAQDSEWISLEGDISAANIQAFAVHRHLEKLSLSNGGLITTKIAKRFNEIESIDWLRLWRPVTRAAIRQLLTTVTVKVLDVLDIRHPGKLHGLALAKNLHTFRVHSSMSEQDIFAASKLPALEQFGAPSGNISAASLAALLEMPKLRVLDFEATNFDDNMALAVSQIERITKLEVGDTRLTGRGLKHLCQMQQLQYLDIWANEISAADLDMLSDLPQLEFLSIGCSPDQVTLTAEGVLPKLEKISSLKRIWLDGIVVSPEQKKALEARYESVRL